MRDASGRLPEKMHPRGVEKALLCNRSNSSKSVLFALPILPEQKTGNKKGLLADDIGHFSTVAKNRQKKRAIVLSEIISLKLFFRMAMGPSRSGQKKC
ncbi:hypothetical protein [uncultured Desulfovibrio sp.]|uniref:hypothetical protein n=1 Tax=uncultured Desulfovibrio sp. TaxID=167968 RepID=UPI002637A031|nr:hypothetical protein [uncultured Desulfovibrio sp.]